MALRESGPRGGTELRHQRFSPPGRGAHPGGLPGLVDPPRCPLPWGRPSWYSPSQKQKRDSNLSLTVSTTMKRFAAMQLCPELIRRAMAKVSAARHGGSMLPDARIPSHEVRRSEPKNLPIGEVPGHHGQDHTNGLEGGEASRGTGLHLLVRKECLGVFRVFGYGLSCGGVHCDQSHGSDSNPLRRVGRFWYANLSSVPAFCDPFFLPTAGRIPSCRTPSNLLD